MSYDRIGNTHIRENGKKRSTFDKVNEMKHDLKSIPPKVEGDKLIAMLSKIRTYLARKNKALEKCTNRVKDINLKTIEIIWTKKKKP